MKSYLNFIVMTIALIGLILSGCGVSEQTQTTDNSEELTIYTTLYPLEFFTNEIGGSHVEVISILPAGADPHTYEPSSKTMVDIAGADGFIYHSFLLESYADKITTVLKEENVTTLAASDSVSFSGHEDRNGEDAHVHEEEHSHEADADADADAHAHQEEHSHETDADPHTWLDPIQAIGLAENIKDTLVELKPEAEQEFEKNFEDLKSRLEKLDEDFHSKLQAQERNEILVTHAAYGYWEKAYGIKQIAISGLSPSEEPSQKQLERVIDIVKEHQINYLLFEQNVKPKVATVIQNETNVAALQLHNLSALTEENMTDKEDYFTLMYHNLDVLVTALEN